MTLKKTMAVVIFMFVALGTGCTREISFKQDVYPVLQKSCLSCHAVGGEGYAASGFSVESYESVMKGTKFGAVIVPGSSISSTLIILVERKADPSINMPLSRKAALARHGEFIMDLEEPRALPPEEISLIKTWIDQGAKNN